MSGDRFTNSIIQGIRSIPMSEQDRVRAENHVRQSAALMDMVLRLVGAGSDKAVSAAR